MCVVAVQDKAGTILLDNQAPRKFNIEAAKDKAARDKGNAGAARAPLMSGRQRRRAGGFTIPPEQRKCAASPPRHLSLNLRSVREQAADEPRPSGTWLSAYTQPWGWVWLRGPVATRCVLSLTLKGEPTVGRRLPKLTSSLGPMNASSSPWSSTPSPQCSHQRDTPPPSRRAR